MSDKLLNGIIVKAFGGFYFVQVGNQVYTCSLRGRLKKAEAGVLVGDKVLMQALGNGEGVVEEILPRQNQLLRPKAANIEQAVLVIAVRDPSPDWMLLDRLLVLVGYAGIEPVVCFNKEDLFTDLSRFPFDIYKEAGFRVVFTGIHNNKGKEELQNILKNKISIMAGPSGVGKTSILNMIQDGLVLTTGEISNKLGRGKHTTRHVQLLPLACGGWVADSPGFSRLDLPQDMTKELLASYYPEIRQVLGKCRFDGCSHYKEPDCAVKKLVATGKFNKERYERYIMLLEELLEREERY